MGRRKYPIGYDIRRILLYFAAAMALWGAAYLVTTGNNLIDFPTRIMLLAVYFGIVYLAEFRHRHPRTA